MRPGAGGPTLGRSGPRGASEGQREGQLRARTAGLGELAAVGQGSRTGRRTSGVARPRRRRRDIADRTDGQRAPAVSQLRTDAAVAAPGRPRLLGRETERHPQHGNHVRFLVEGAGRCEFTKLSSR